MTDLAQSCAAIAALLPHAEQLITRPDQDGTTGSTQPGSTPPWNGPAATAVMNAHEGLRRLEASLRQAVTGHPGHRRGGSQANTTAAIRAIENLGHGVTTDASAEAARILDRWSRQIQELPAIDQAEPWRRITASCPYCGCRMLRVAARSGQVTCLRYGACADSDGRHPVGRLDISRLSGDAIITWADGLVTP